MPKENPRMNLYLDPSECKAAMKKACAEIDPKYNLSMLVRQLLHLYLKGKAKL